MKARGMEIYQGRSFKVYSGMGRWALWPRAQDRLFKEDAKKLVPKA
jgi:hypothetical protein